MDYKKIYYSLIEKAKNRRITGYFERHHIIPRCMGGSDEKENLVKLTPEEHYLSHQLLVKMYPEHNGLVLAASMMTSGRPSNKLYGWLRRRHSIAMKEFQRGEGNSQFGTVWISKEISEKKVKKEELEEHLLDGWTTGRLKTKVSKNCKYCNAEFNSSSCYCSKKCKRYYRSSASKIIDENLDAMITSFMECKSIDKTLKSFGIQGTRAGNSYFSGILKDRGIEVVSRRNKMPS